jgi:hypothetical protein
LRLSIHQAKVIAKVLENKSLWLFIEEFANDEKS